MKKQLTQLGILVLLCLALAQPAVWADTTSTLPHLPKGITQLSTVEGITEYRLTNGLTVLLMPDLSEPMVTVNVTYLVGSRFENYGETGMAHLLEHMLFKGTPTMPKIDVEFNQRGMKSNASTSLDYTNYFEQFEASDSNLQWAIKMEADRMVHANIAKKDLDSEMPVVRNEYEMGENSPINVLLKRLQSVAFDWHSYGRPTIGNRSDIENVQIENLKKFYRLYYQPDNAVLLIAGKFDVNKTLGWIASDFGAIPKPTRRLPQFWTVEPAQDGERNFFIRRGGDIQIVMVAYKIPSDLHPDNNALSFAADILSDDPSGRLYKSLVETGKAVEVFDTRIGGYGTYAPGLQVIGAVVKKDDPLEPVKDAMIATIESFANTPPTLEEMERLKRSYRNEREKMLTHPETIGLALSDEMALGDWRYFFLRRDQTDHVTSEQVATAAARYFKRDNRTVGMFIPDDLPDAARIVEVPAAPSIKKVMENFIPTTNFHHAEIFDPSLENIDKRTVHQTVGGLNIAMLDKKNRGEAVSVVLNLHWGDEKSLFGKKAVSAMTADMLTLGNKKYTRQQLKDEFAKLKITGTVYQFDTTRKNLPAALALMAQIVKEPSFPRNEFNQLKKQIIANLESQLSDPSALAIQAIKKHFNHYPKGDWRATETIAEQIASFRSVKLDDVKAFHRHFYGTSRGDLTIVGDVDIPSAMKAVKQHLSSWASRATYSPINETYLDVVPVQININTPDKESGSYVARMNLNLNDGDADYPALMVANYIVGGGAGLNSRIMQRIREKDGLSYGGGSGLNVHALDNAASFQLSASAAPQNLSKLAVAMKEELKRACEEGFSADEVARAKSGLRQRAVRARSQDASLALELNSNQYLHRDVAWAKAFEDKVDALTVEQVNAAFKKWIDPGKLTVVIAGDEKK